MGLPDNVCENTPSTDLKSEDTSLIACANCLQKKPNIEKKTKKNLTPTVSKKSQICEIWRQNSKSGNPGVLRRPALSISFADL